VNIIVSEKLQFFKTFCGTLDMETFCHGKLTVASAVNSHSTTFTNLSHRVSI